METITHTPVSVVRVYRVSIALKMSSQIVHNTQHQIHYRIPLQIVCVMLATKQLQITLARNVFLVSIVSMKLFRCVLPSAAT